MADSAEMVLLGAVRAGLSGLVKFQDFCGIGEADPGEAAAAALLRVHVEAVAGSRFVAPGALLQLLDAKDERRSSGSGWSYWPKGQVMLELRGLVVVAEGEDFEDKWRAWVESARQVKWALAEWATGAAGVQFRSMMELEGPGLMEEDQWEMVASGAVGSYVVYWGFVFELA